MAVQRKQYDEAFKRKAVADYLVSGKSRTEFTKQLGLSTPSMLHRWVSEFGHKKGNKKKSQTAKADAPGAKMNGDARRHAIAYLKHAQKTKSERIRAALTTLALATLEGEI